MTWAWARAGAWALAWACAFACAFAVASACGSATVRPTTLAERERATMQRLELRGAVEAMGLADGRVAVAAYDDRARSVVLGAAEVGERWDAQSLVLRPIARGAPMFAATLDGDGVALVQAGDAGRGVRVMRAPIEGARATRVAGKADAAPSRLAIARDARGRLWTAWLEQGAPPTVARIDGATLTVVSHALPAQTGGDVALAATDGVLAVARASSAGVDVMWLAIDEAAGPRARATISVSQDAADDVAARALGDQVLVAWSGALGVEIAALRAGAIVTGPTRVDDGARRGEPAHRVGAALAMDVSPSGDIVLSYQDQTAGTLVFSRGTVGSMRRAERADRAWTRAMHTSVAWSRGRPWIVETALRSAPRLETMLRAVGL